MTQSRNLFPLVLIFLAAASPGAAQESTDLPFFMPTPEGWQTETIPLPLDFAPEIDYEGLEELRFSPGMFKEMKLDFWSYAFVWWVPEAVVFDADILTNDLENYFRGLIKGVAETRGFDPGDPKLDVQLQPAEPTAPGRTSFTGSVLTYDAFVTRRPIRLTTRVDILSCSAQGHLAAVFQFSPQPTSHRIWEVLEDIREGFRCER